MTSKKKSIQDQIADLLNPVAPDAPEDYSDVDETRAKVVEEFDENTDDEVATGRSVRPHIALDDDPRYVGKKASRKSLGFQEKSQPVKDAERSDESLEESEEDNEGDEESMDEGGEESMDEGNEEGEEEEGAGSGGDDDDDDYEDIESDEQNTGEKSVEDSFQHISIKNVESEVEKGKAVKNQLGMWDSLLECRIHMQKCLVAANQLPKFDTIQHFKQNGGDEFNSALAKNETNVKSLLDKLLTLQKTLVSSFPESKDVFNSVNNSKPLPQSDEEIPSDTEDEGESETKEVIKSVPVSEEVPEPKVKRRRLEDFEDSISLQHKQYNGFRNTIIQKWNDRTRVATGKLANRNFSAFEQSTLQQIQHVLTNHDRLLHRTQLRRAITFVLGEPREPADKNGEQNGPSEELKVQAEPDPEIFDDSDFYQQLLRELIERRSGAGEDAAALARRWAALQKMRARMKRRIDVRATKGRRLRYDPHPKLVGYMAPIAAPCAWSDQAIAELHASLFGNNKRA